jgi:hypothetical protein
MNLVNYRIWFRVVKSKLTLVSEQVVVVIVGGPAATVKLNTSMKILDGPTVMADAIENMSPTVAVGSKQNEKAPPILLSPASAVSPLSNQTPTFHFQKILKILSELTSVKKSKSSTYVYDGRICRFSGREDLEV